MDNGYKLILQSIENFRQEILDNAVVKEAIEQFGLKNAVYLRMSNGDTLKVFRGKIVEISDQKHDSTNEMDLVKFSSNGDNYVSLKVGDEQRYALSAVFERRKQITGSQDEFDALEQLKGSLNPLTIDTKLTSLFIELNEEPVYRPPNRYRW